ncbi:hypothetical protein ABEB36_014896 [Hypothenemus hampei]|uniref:Dynein regulatory complex subunit 2 n=1 Tax=Hypothenemus hampei TaxID=57062 RepID=A0ABD1E169_HYPHA
MPPKLTPEEKKALRVTKKAEKKKKQIEKKKQVKRDLLERELKYGALTLKRHERDWRQMLIDLTIPEMLKDLEFAWHNFERVVDSKDFIIGLLLDELDQANQQYFLNLKTHSEHIDQLIQMFSDRVNELQMDFQKQTEDLQGEHEKLVEQFTDSASDKEKYLKTILYILQMEMKEVKRTRHSDYFSKLEEQDSKQHQLIQRMKGILEQVHLQLWMDTMHFLDDYKNRIKQRKKQHNKLKTEDDKLQILINQQMEHIRKAYNTIRSLKLKKSELEKFLGRRLADLQSEFDFFTYALNTLRSNLSKDCQLDFRKLNCLTMNYNNVITHLENLEVTGKHILHVGIVCRKLETLEEKILPFPNNFINEMSKSSLGKFKDYADVLDLFWQRVGNVDATRYSINEEREFLITENEILKRRLHDYCQCMKCPNFDPFKTKAKPCATITEGTSELKKYLKHGSLVAKFLPDESNNKNLNKSKSLDLISWNDDDSPFKTS